MTGISDNNKLQLAKQRTTNKAANWQKVNNHLKKLQINLENSVPDSATLRDVDVSTYSQPRIKVTVEFYVPSLEEAIPIVECENWDSESTSSLNDGQVKLRVTRDLRSVNLR